MRDQRIDVWQELDPTEAQRRHRRAHLRLARLPEVFLRRHRRLAAIPTLATRHPENVYRHPPPGSPGERPACEHRLIIRVRADDEYGL